MELRELEEYKEEELESVNSLKRRLKAKKSKISPVDFFPELNLNTPYCAPNIHPFWVSLPYYNTILFYLLPFENEQILREVHGVSVNQLIDLLKNGKVDLILGGNPILYSGLDYLDPILELKPPVYTSRLSGYLESLVNHEDLKQFQDEAVYLFSGKMNNIKKKIGAKTPTWAFEKSQMTAYVNLRSLGYDSITDEIMIQNALNFDISAWMTEVYHDLLCAPITTSLDGSHLISKTYLTSALQMNSSFGFSSPAPNNRLVFPFEAGKCLTERYHLVRPNNINHALDIFPDYHKARSALKALDKYVEDKSRDKIMDCARTLESAFKEVQEIKLKEERFETSLQIIGVTGATFSVLFGGCPGILGALGFGLLSTKVAKPLGTILAKITKADHIIVLFEFEKFVKEKWS